MPSPEKRTFSRRKFMQAAAALSALPILAAAPVPKEKVDDSIQRATAEQLSSQAKASAALLDELMGRLVRLCWPLPVDSLPGER